MLKIQKQDNPIQTHQLTEKILEITGQIVVSYMNHATEMAKISNNPDKYFTLSVKQLIEEITQSFKKHYSF